MSSAWLLWYGLRIGLTRTETLTIPVGELMSLIAVHQIKVEGHQRKLTQEEELDEFFDLLEWR